MNIYEPSKENRAAWDDWVETRPACVREVIEKFGFEPWKLYRLKSNGHRVTIRSIDEPENGPPTLQVYVSGDFNFVAFERTVFGVKPEDLEECDLPAPSEVLGSANMTPEEVCQTIGVDPPHEHSRS